MTKITLENIILTQSPSTLFSAERGFSFLFFLAKGKGLGFVGTARPHPWWYLNSRFSWATVLACWHGVIRHPSPPQNKTKQPSNTSACRELTSACRRTGTTLTGLSTTAPSPRESRCPTPYRRGALLGPRFCGLCFGPHLPSWTSWE